MPPSGRDRAFIALVTLSGLAALVYQVAWARRLALLFGASTYAVATVLAAFLGGLALGARWLGPILDRRRRPLRAYALLEAGIGVYALLFPFLGDQVEAVYVIWAQMMPGSLPLRMLARVVLAGGLLLPPTFLMGGTLPAMCRVYLRDDRALARDLGMLYGFNTLGAVAGALLAGFVLLGSLGLRGTILAAGALNLTLAAVAAWLDRETPGTESIGPEAARTPPSPAPVDVRVVLAASAVAGFTALGYEVLWVRALVTMLHTGFTYAFSLMLATFLSGIVLGSLIYSRWLVARSDLRTFARAQLALGAWAVFSVWLLAQAPGLEVQAAARGWIGLEYTWGSWIGQVALASAAVMIVPTTLMGICFPLAAALVAREHRNVGARVGVLYAWNTVGSIAGSLVSGFLLIPWIGTFNALVLLGALNLLLAMGLTWGSVARMPERVAATLGVMALIAGCAVITPRDYFRQSLARWRVGKPLYFAEDLVGVVEIYQQPASDGTFYRRLFVNGTSYASTSSYARTYHKLLGHLPALLHPAPERTLVIAFGTGMTAGALVRHDAVLQVDAVDLSPAVFRGADLFSRSNGDVLSDPKFHARVEDGRNHLLLHREGYDLITLEPPPPRFAGVASLYSREFYDLCRARLHPGGVVAQWIPMHSHTEPEMRELVRAFVDVFPEATLWLPVQRDAILVGAVGPLDLDADRIVARMRDAGVAADLRDIGLGEPAALLATLFADGDGLVRYVRGVDPVTDDRPTIEYFVGRPLVERSVHLERLLPYRLSAAELDRLVGGMGRALARYHEAMGHYYAGAVRGDHGDGPGRAREWIRAWETAPESPFFQRIAGRDPPSLPQVVPASSGSSDRP